MSHHILLRGARQVLTLHGPQSMRRGAALRELSVIPDGSVLLDGSAIKSVGTTRRIENLKEARDAMEIDARDCIVMPGFADPALMIGGENPFSRKPRPRKPREIYDESLELLRNCLQHGTVTTGLTAAESSGPASVMPLLRQWLKIGNTPVGMKRTWKIARAPQLAEEFEQFRTGLAVLQQRKLIDFLEVPAAALSSPAIAFLTTLSGIPLRIDCTDADPKHLYRELNRMRTLSVACSTWMDEQDAQVVAGLTGIALFSPCADLSQGCGTGMRSVIDRGGAIALTAGYHSGHALCYSMQMAIARAVAAGQVTVEEAITAATVNAACALGQGHQAGTIEAGRRADLIVLSIPDYRDLPRHFGINQVRTVVRGGEVVYNRGRWKMGPNVQTVPDSGMRSEYLRRSAS